MNSVQKAHSWATQVSARAGPRQRREAARAIWNAPSGGASFYGTQGYRWQQVLEGYRHWSFVAIGAYMRAIAGADHPQIGRVVHKGATQKSKSWGCSRHITKTLGGPGPNHEFHEFEPDDPMCRIFHRPNQFDVAYDWWSYVVLFHMLMGYATVWVRRDQHGIPREMWPIPTHWVQQLRLNSDGLPDVYIVQSPWGHVVEIPFEETVSLTEHSPFSRYEGYAVSIAIAEWLDTYESLVRVRLAQFKNGAVPNIHVELGESYSDPDEAFLNRFYAKWFARFQGENQAGLPLITGADVKVTQIGAMQYEMFTAGDESIRTQVLAAYGVPQSLITGDPTNDTSAYAPIRSFARFRINPLLRYYGEVFTEKVLKVTPGYEDAILFWRDQAPKDPQVELQRHQAKYAAGAETPNEWRLEDGQEPYPHGGDNPMVNGAELPWVTGKQPDPADQADAQQDNPAEVQAAARRAAEAHPRAGLAKLFDRAHGLAYGRGASESQLDHVRESPMAHVLAAFDAMPHRSRVARSQVQSVVDQAHEEAKRLESEEVQATLGESGGAAGGYLAGNGFAQRRDQVMQAARNGRH